MQHSTAKKASVKSNVDTRTKKVLRHKANVGLIPSRKSAVQKRPTAAIRARTIPDAKVISQIRSLARNYDFTASIGARILDVSPKTYSRYLENAKALSEQQKDRLNIVEYILTLGKRVLGSEEEVKRWLKKPVHSIENQKPIDLIVSESGRRRVENVLLQLEGGAY